MRVYHLSDTLQSGAALSPDFKEHAALAEPFVQSLSRGAACFYSVLYSAKYLKEVLRKFGQADMQTDFVKWAVEGVFEYVRRTEFPGCCSRLKCNYYFAAKEDCAQLFAVDWGRADAEERGKIRLFEVELSAGAPERRDMRLFDDAYDAFWEDEDLEAALGYARRYFSGGESGTPMWEIVSGADAVAVRDLSDWLHGVSENQKAGPEQQTACD